VLKLFGQEFEEPDTPTKFLKLNEKETIEPYNSQRFSIRITLTAILAALAIGASYMLAPFINIEVMSVLLFIAGFIFGKLIGAIVGLISSLIYYGWNPFGISAIPLYLVCVASMTFIGFVGGLLRPSPSPAKRIEVNRLNIIKLALIGFCFTLLFDIITNIIYAVFYYGGDIRLSFITGFPWMIVHLVSNTVIFAVLVIPVYNAVNTLQ